MKRYEKLRELREDAGISQQRLSSYLCVHQTTYSEYELGKINVPVDVFIKLSRLYGVSLEYILGLTGERIIPPRVNRHGRFAKCLFSTMRA